MFTSRSLLSMLTVASQNRFYGVWWGELIQYHYFKEKNTYVLNQHIEIKISTIRAVAESDGEFSTDEKALGLHNAHIQMKGTDNLFRINSTDTLVQLNLKKNWILKAVVKPIARTRWPNL